MRESDTAATYTNPVFAQSFPDPFVLKFRGRYYAYSTGMAADGQVFGMLTSSNLVDWEVLGGAMAPLAQAHPHYWAPEVTYYNCKFYLYYSVGNETLMEIRVAVAERPDGPFHDVGRRLTKEVFAIDPHVFRDDTGDWYMFYATDFLEHTHVGTGTVVDQMIDPFTLAGKPRPVTRARYDWQVYDPQRKEKGGVRWHTVEGPFVLQRKGLYYEMFSGGNWQNETYGVSFAVSDTIHREDEWNQHSDGDKILPILRSIPGRIRGPGHNSVVVGPNNRELYCVYHAWTEAGRVLAIDRMDFSGPGQMFIVGPTDSPQPAPYATKKLSTTALEARKLGGISGTTAPGTLGNAEENSEVSFDLHGLRDGRFYVAWSASAREGTFGIRLRAGETELFTLEFNLAERSAYTEWAGSRERLLIQLPAEFDPASAHDLFLDLAGESASLILDGHHKLVSADLPAIPTTIALYSQGAQVEIGPLEMTPGFEELFDFGDIFKRGWNNDGNSEGISIENGVLRMEGNGENIAALTRNVDPGDYELCLNFRFPRSDALEQKLIFACGNMLTMTPGLDEVIEIDGIPFAIPANCEPGIFHQIRSIKDGSAVQFFLDAEYIGSVPAIDDALVKMTVHGAVVEIDMVRYTLID
jgi:arabinan endo-1,5-alpha-L-arabinosidase